MGWSSAFDDPIPLPDGRALRTSRDAADYMAALPAATSAAARSLRSRNLINAADHDQRRFRPDAGSHGGGNPAEPVEVARLPR
jgi:hypothetical protein